MRRSSSSTTLVAREPSAFKEKTSPTIAPSTLGAISILADAEGQPSQERINNLDKGGHSQGSNQS